MPDYSPNIPSPTALYPQPPSGTGFLSGGPAGVLDALGKMQSLDIQQRDIAARNAIGDAAIRNTDPKTGAIDPAGFARDISSNPAAAWKAQEALTTLYNQQEALQRMGTANLNTIHREFGNLKNDFDDEQLNRTFLNLQNVPGMNHELLATARAQIPPMPKPGDPDYDKIMAQRNDIVAGHRKSLMTVEQAEAPHEVTVDQYGNKVVVPGTEYLRPGGGAGAPGGAAGAGGTGTGTGGAGGAGSSGLATPATTPTYTGGAGVAISPGRQKVLDEAMTQGTQLLNSRDDLSREHQLLTTLQVLGRNLDNEFTGPLSKDEQYYRGIASRIVPGIDDQNLSRAQLYNKILNQVITAQRGMGKDAVADLGVIQAANPNLAMTPHAKEGAANQLLANNEFRDAMRQHFEAAGGNRAPRMYADWRQANAVFDPAVFAYNRLTPDERQEYYRTLPVTRRAQLADRYRQAASLGLVEPPR